MRVLVLGAGVIGVTTAYQLALRGHEVTVIERRDALAAEASYANGGQLSYDFASPMASPSILRRLTDYVLGRDEAFQIKLSADPKFLRWGSRFIVNCAPAVARTNAKKLSALAHESYEALARVTKDTGIEFEHRKAGKLVLFDNAQDFAQAQQKLDQSVALVGTLKAVSADEALSIEPTLNQWRGRRVTGALYAPDDEVGDAHAFTNALANLLAKQYGVKFLLGKSVREIHVRRNHRLEVELDDGFVDANAVVVCLGVNSRRLLAPHGVSAPIWPIYGYSLTAPAGVEAPETAITDLGKKMVYSRIGDKLRVAGFADAAAAVPANSNDRLALLEKIARQTFPQAADFDAIASRWVGMRPSTPNSLPIVGPTRVKNLFVNIGHGMFGWTLSAVCAERVAASVSSVSVYEHKLQRQAA